MTNQLHELGASDVTVPAMGTGTILGNIKKSNTKDDILQAYVLVLTTG
jgi:hypothetical protein